MHNCDALFHLHLLFSNLALIGTSWIPIVKVVFRLMVWNYCHLVYLADRHLSQYCRDLWTPIKHDRHLVLVTGIPELK